MPPNLKLNAVAFISPQNYPILIKTFVKHEDPVKYHYIAHTSLDIIEERGSWLHSVLGTVRSANSRRIVTAGGKACECYLGLLFAMEDVAVYGYITPLKVKIVIALPLTDSVVRDAEITTVNRFPFWKNHLILVWHRAVTDIQSLAYGILFFYFQSILKARRFKGEWGWTVFIVERWEFQVEKLHTPHRGDQPGCRNHKFREHIYYSTLTHSWFGSKKVHECTSFRWLQGFSPKLSSSHEPIFTIPSYWLSPCYRPPRLGQIRGRHHSGY